MPVEISSTTNNKLQPSKNPHDARGNVGVFGPNLTLAAGTVLGEKTSDGKLYPYSNAASDGTQTAVSINIYPLRTDAQGNVYWSDSNVPSELNVPFKTSQVYEAGTFRKTDLTGWDAAAMADFGAHEDAHGNVVIPS